MCHFFGSKETSCLVCAFFYYPITLSPENISGVKWCFTSRQASRYFPFFAPLVLRQFFVWLSPIILCCVCVNNTNVKDTHRTMVSEANPCRITTYISAKLSSSVDGHPPVPCLWPALPPVVGASPADSTIVLPGWS